MICVSGGIYETSRRSVEIYDPDNGPRGHWNTLPNLNKGRACHASCSVGSMIYIFSGVEKDGINPPKKTTIERLLYDRNGSANGTWELLKFSQKQFPMRKHLGVVPIS